MESSTLLRVATKLAWSERCVTKEWNLTGVRVNVAKASMNYHGGEWGGVRR